MAKTKKKEDVERRLMTSRQVMDMFCISARTLQNWRASGFLQPVKLGGMYRYKECDVNRIYDSL